VTHRTLRLGERVIAFDAGSDEGLQRLQQQVRAELKDEEADPPARRHSLEKKYRRGLKEIDRLLAATLQNADSRGRNDSVALLLEAVAALNNDQRSPLPRHLDTAQMPWVLASKLYAPVGHGDKPATNLQLGPDNDLSRLEPLPSTFWQRPANIAEQDLYRGFGRTNLLVLGDKLCAYAGPKESYGMNPGFEVECDGVTIKLKFAEVSSEPFAARIFDALGYHAEPTDYARQVKVRYDRKILREFHSRKEMKTRFTLLGFIPVYTMDLQKRFDPFDYIATAVLRDGRRWSGRELKMHLFHDAARAHPEDEESNFRPELEGEIAYLVTVPANVQAREAGIKSIGPWDFGQLDHADRRELRGAGLLAAWLGWFDTRFDNTRLRVVKQGEEVVLAHYFSDLGGVLGETGSLLFSRGELPNAFPWSFTRPPLWQGPHRLARPLRLEGYKPIAYAAPFAAMTLDDARWAARLIGQLTEAQLVQALVASGYDSAEVRLYTEKLLSRRDRMVCDLGLSDEIPLCRPRREERRFSYNPAREGPVKVQVPGLGGVEAPGGDKKIVTGILVEIHHAERSVSDRAGAL